MSVSSSKCQANGSVSINPTDTVTYLMLLLHLSYLMELLHPLPRLPLTVAHAVPQELHALSLNANAHSFRLIPIHGAFILAKPCRI